MLTHIVTTFPFIEIYNALTYLTIFSWVITPRLPRLSTRQGSIAKCLFHAHQKLSLGSDSSCAHFEESGHIPAKALAHCLTCYTVAYVRNVALIELSLGRHNCSSNFCLPKATLSLPHCVLFKRNDLVCVFLF